MRPVSDVYERPSSDHQATREMNYFVLLSLWCELLPATPVIDSKIVNRAQYEDILIKKLYRATNEVRSEFGLKGGVGAYLPGAYLSPLPHLPVLCKIKFLLGTFQMGNIFKELLITFNSVFRENLSYIIKMMQKIIHFCFNLSHTWISGVLETYKEHTRVILHVNRLQKLPLDVGHSDF